MCFDLCCFGFCWFCCVGLIRLFGNSGSFIYFGFLFLYIFTITFVYGVCSLILTCVVC